MIDGQQLLTSLAHAALGGKQFFRSGFVGDQRIGGHIAQPIKSLGAPLTGAADQSATLFWACLLCVGKYFVDLGTFDYQWTTRRIHSDRKSLSIED